MIHKLVLTAILLATPAFAYEPFVEKQEFTLTDFKTRGGGTVPETHLIRYVAYSVSFTNR